MALDPAGPDDPPDPADPDDDPSEAGDDDAPEEEPVEPPEPDSVPVLAAAAPALLVAGVDERLSVL